MENNKFDFIEPLTEDMLGNLKGGFGIFGGECLMSSAANVAVTVPINGGSCSCKCNGKKVTLTPK
jgi:hypothetical protein